MNIKMLKAAVAGMILSVFFIVNIVNAGLIQDTSSDSFIDLSTNLEWMDFGINNGQSYNFVASQLGAGGAYEGWALASYDQVYTMINNVYYGIGASDEFIPTPSTLRVEDTGTTLESLNNIIGVNRVVNQGTAVEYTQVDSYVEKEDGFAWLQSGMFTGSSFQNNPSWVDTIYFRDAGFFDPTVGYEWSSTFLVRPPTTTEPTIFISDFSNSGIDNWDIGGNGTVEIATSPDGSGDNVMQMTIDVTSVNDPISSSIMIDIPNDPFDINFDYLFQTPTGSLEVWLMDELLDTFFAADVYDIDATELLAASILVEDQSLLDFDQGLLKFSLYPGSDAGVVIGDITLNSSTIPEPSTLAIFALGMIGIATRRFKKQSQ